MIARNLPLFAFLVAGCAGAPPATQKLPPAPPPASVTPVSVSETSAPRPDFSKLPAPGATPTWSLPKPEIFSLSNGMRVYFLKQGSTPLVSLLLVLPRGASTDPKGKAGLTALTADLLDEGVAGKSALELSEDLQRLGTDYGASSDVDSVMLAMNTIADSLGESVKLLSSIVQKPAFDPKEFARVKAQRIADALAAESEPASARAIVLRKALFGDGYGGQVPDGTRTTLKNVTLGDVKAQYHALVASEGAAFVVVGGIDAAPVKQALESEFGSWKTSAKARPLPVSKAKPERAIYFVDFPGATQSALAIARRAPGEGSPEHFPAIVMSRVFGESFTSRLNLNLREAKGFTYGASSSFRRWKEAGFFALATSVKRETTRPSIDESLKELGDICGARPISATERDDAVAGLLLGFPGRFERDGDVAGQLASLPLYGRPDDWLEKWPSKLKATSVEDANQVAKEYCKPDDYVIVVAGDRKVVEPSLQGLERKLLFFDGQGSRTK